MRKVDWQKILKYLIMFLVPTLVVLITNHGLDNDSWYVLAQGRSILEHGIYHEDVLSMHEGLHVVVQNYAFSVIFYLIYSAFGPAGIYTAMILLNLLIIWLLYKICMLLSSKNQTLSMLIAAATDVVLAFGFVVTRAQMIDYVVFLLLIWVLEIVIRTKKNGLLMWIPVLSLFLINFHASTWWIIFAIMVAYGIDMLVRQKRLHQKFNWKAYIGVFGISIVIGLINPYGIEMISSIFGGYDGLKNLDYILELKPFSPLTGWNLIFYLSITVAICLYIYGKKKIYLRHLLLFLGFLMMGMTSIKGMSELILTMFVPVAYIFQDVKFRPIFNVQKIGRGVLIWSSICLICVTPAVFGLIAINLQDYPNQPMKEIMDLLDEKTVGQDKSELKVFVDYNQGGYVEYRGYPAYLDPRGEYFLESVNGKEDIIEEFLNLKENSKKIQDFLDKYDFDYLITEDDDLPGEMVEGRYQKIRGESDDDYKLYEKVDNG